VPVTSRANARRTRRETKVVDNLRVELRNPRQITAPAQRSLAVAVALERHVHEEPTRLHRPSESPGNLADELGWPDLVDPLARDADVIVTLNYGEAGALEMKARRLPVVASGCHLRVLATARRCRNALAVGFQPQQTTFCR